MRARLASFLGYFGETAAGVAATSDSGSDGSGADMDIGEDAADITATAQPKLPVSQQQQQRSKEGGQDTGDITAATRARAGTAGAQAVTAAWGGDGSAGEGESPQLSVAASEALIAAGTPSPQPIYADSARF